MRSIKLLLSSALIATTLSAELVNLKEGWNLIGLSTATTVDNLIQNNKNITKIWIYDEEFKDTGDIKPTDGVWAHSDSDIQLNINNVILNKDEDIEILNRVDKINLNDGWNLISLPVNSAISPKMFENVHSVWKFNNSSWSKFGGSDNDDSFPKIDVIGSGDGFWINSDGHQSIYLSDEESKLTNFDSNEKMNEYLEAMINYNKNYRTNQNIYPIYVGGVTDEGMAVPTAMPIAEADTSTNGENSVKVDNATTTNLQEDGVDEADIVKHDGENIFYLPSNWDNTEIYVNTFERILAGENKYLTSIKLESKPNELYLIDDKLIVIYPYNNSFWGIWESTTSNIWSEKSKIEVYNVSNLEDIQKVNEYSIDGNIVDSRVANSKLYLVTKYMPYIEVEYPKVYVECEEYVYDNKDVIYPEEPTTGVEVGVMITETALTPAPVNRDEIAVTATTVSVDSDIAEEPRPESSIAIEPYPYEDYSKYCYNYTKNEDGKYYKLDYENPQQKALNISPSINDNLNETSRELITGESLYAPSKFDQASFITSITSFELDDISKQESISIVGGSSTIYANNKALYVTTNEYPIYFGWNDYQERTSIYKFSIEDKLSYNGKSFADGHILNQFSLSEHNDILRVATTSGWSWRNDTDNMITTIEENEDGLNNIGKLEGLGKEGETIKAVRFLGDRGFIVTFRQTDPLYTIDLSDPANPKSIGELEIEGYSSYFHPIDENRILSVGRDADEEGRTKGLQLELFDISDFANPLLADKVTIGEDWRVNSEAEHNHKAFTYRSSDFLFALPINQTLSREMNESEKSEYFDKYYLNYNEKIEYYDNIDSDTDEDISVESSNVSEGNSTSETSVEPIEPTVTTEPTVDTPMINSYQNYLDIYKVDGLEIKSIDKIDSNSTTYNYNYQRGIIFTSDSKDYGLYVAGGELFLKEINYEE